MGTIVIPDDIMSGDLPFEPYAVVHLINNNLQRSKMHIDDVVIYLLLFYLRAGWKNDIVQIVVRTMLHFPDVAAILLTIR